MIYIGVDDTDSPKGMCTTYIIAKLVPKIVDMGLDIIGYPRLVRLNPTIPWKTRGNGAVCLRVGKGFGKKFPVVFDGYRTIHAYGKGKGLGDIADIFSIVRSVVKKHYYRDEKTSPGFLVCPRAPPEKFYWKCVRGVVSKHEVLSFLDVFSCMYGGFNGSRGLIGALGAVAWRARDKTYEILTYRHEENFGKPRKIDKDSVIAMDKEFPSTFNNYDYNNDYIAIAPNTKCPVLFGIRGDDDKELLDAMREVVCGEDLAAWVIFETNQATDDHILFTKVRNIKPYTSVAIEGVIATKPEKIQGGHVVFSLNDGDIVDCVAYEPTKEFRNVVMKLYPGDLVRVFGSVRVLGKKYSINLEKILVKKVVEVREKVNPICPNCGKSMCSLGKAGGYKCKRCGTRVGEDKATVRIIKRDIKPGWYEAPVCARRHLYMHIDRMIRSGRRKRMYMM
ncbi:MAG: DNA-binding protein [Thermoplasmata archaeon]|nr:MAG: DNA-binding protein [Thermoplasmata archaeon]